MMSSSKSRVTLSLLGLIVSTLSDFEKVVPPTLTTAFQLPVGAVAAVGMA